MKKIFMLLAVIGLMTTVSFAQKATISNRATTTNTTVKYYCPVCMASSDKPGVCPKCKRHYVKVGDYYCTSCDATFATKTTVCPKCGSPVKQMVAPANKK